MKENLPFVLSIAGFDPSGGAGILADIKTFETAGVRGLGVITSVTYQNESSFEGVDWLSAEDIIRQVIVLEKKYRINFIKIGLIKDLETLSRVVDHLLGINPERKIIWDPIIKASAGFLFHEDLNNEKVNSVLEKLFIITPNLPEAEALGLLNTNANCAVLIKGGHKELDANDVLLLHGEKMIIPGERIAGKGKHGTGCVLSSFITARLAIGLNLVDSCIEGKNYISSFIRSSDDLLGFHYSKENVG